VEQEIQSAIQAGKEVTVHEKPISAHGWTGYGYIITDPETGAGGYMIEGKGNGAILLAFVAGLLSVLILFLFGPFAILGWGWMLMASLSSAVYAIDAMDASVNWNFVIASIGLFLAIIALIPGLLVAGSAAAWAAGIFGALSAIWSFVVFFI